jgi:hypothetical protein
MKSYTPNSEGFLAIFISQRFHGKLRKGICIPEETFALLHINSRVGYLTFRADNPKTVVNQTE